MFRGGGGGSGFIRWWRCFEVVVVDRVLSGGLIGFYQMVAVVCRRKWQDQPIDVENVECDDDKRKRKAPPKPRKTTSECWKYFDPKMEADDDGTIIKWAYCKWCPAVFKADSRLHGTRQLNTHYKNCNDNPDIEKFRKQRKLAFKKNIGENDAGGSSMGTLETWKYDEKDIKQSLIELIVLAELPFKFVEHPAFIKYSAKMQPRFNLPSRFTIARDISKFYLEERKSLLNFLSNKDTTVHLTTDTWTSSCKRMNFMVLTAHFIDDDRLMHKRIINFRPIHSHRGVDIGRELLECINGWGIKNVMTITVDNIASNDKALEYLVENLPDKSDESVEKTCTSKKFLVSECPTRWNSTHDMLKTAIELKEAFCDYDLITSLLLETLRKYLSGLILRFVER
ncbi:zinc finger BED domain-containing protein RICESLEEPER 2 [Artemisia annua]|uniref:Zinc finger BED domain-containing protein RICESLEEPER 2 n=1 Tax=Artemisia annua TaxID=35608 RepID=A0A2U1LKP6_ARTAN|nr:zinc finger BED domain-containing protein RICESLEEPER 2 [Artemisia annua]